MNTRADLTIVRQAALHYARARPGPTVQYLRAQKRVAAVALGRDGRTIDVLFRDGFHSMLLPQTHHPVSTLPAQLVAGSHRLRTMWQTGRRALILEPFATELNLGPGAGTGIASILQAGGFSVDALSNSAVTVDTMSTLSQYNVVYIDTHAGVNQYGEGVVVTGQEYNADPKLDAMAKQNTVFAVGVAGSPLIYYGILSGYIRTYESQFPANALVFINGCDMLRATLFWQALESKGAGAMPSWDQEVLPADADAAGTIFLNAMKQGRTVREALSAVEAAGLSVSSVPGQPPAHFGYLGNGEVRIDGSVASAPTATVVPATAAPTVTPTATPLPSPTRAVSPTVVLKRQVRPGSRQLIVVTASPYSPVHVSVQYPNGDRQATTLRTDAQGSASYSYRQPASRITRYSSIAHVTVTTGGNGEVTHNLQRSYQVAFADLDVVVAPRVVSARHRLDVWVHSRVPGQATVSITGGSLQASHALKSVVPGWKHVAFTAPARPSGSREAGENVQASMLSAGKTLTTRTTFTIR